MTRAEVYHDVARRELLCRAVIELKVDFAVDENAIIHGVRRVHAGLSISNFSASPGCTCMYSPPAATGSKVGVIITESGGNVTNTTLVPPAAGTHDFATVVGSVLSAGTVAPPLTLSIASIVRVL